MIQRIQSLFLLLSVAAGALMFYFPIATYLQNILSDNPTGNYILFITGLQCLDPDPGFIPSLWFAAPLWILTGTSVLLGIITIIMYKKRYIQLRLVAFNILLTIVYIVLVFVFYFNKIETLTGNEAAYQTGTFLPLVSLVFLVLANRYIRKDEALVKSTNRLR